MSEDVKQNELVGGWETLDSNVVYENAWIRVNHENVLTPAKTPGIYGRVHFKNRAVGVLPIDESGQTWLVKQSRYVLNCYTLEIPEGGAPEGEDLLSAAKRELEEECGLIAGKWTKLRTLHQSNSVTDEEAHLFLAEEIRSGQQALEDTEDIEIIKEPFTKTLQRVMDDEITDALSVAAILQYALMKNIRLD